MKLRNLWDLHWHDSVGPGGVPATVGPVTHGPAVLLRVESYDAPVGEELGEVLPGLVHLLVDGLGPGDVDEGAVHVEILGDGGVERALGGVAGRKVDEGVVLMIVTPVIQFSEIQVDISSYFRIFISNIVVQ